MSDAELEQALKASLGIFGGSGGQISITYQGSGLKIWGSWEVHNHVTETPLFAGKSTVAMARLVYGIKIPPSRSCSSSKQHPFLFWSGFFVQ